MNRKLLVTLADAVQAIRPDWQQAGILAALAHLEQGWPGTDAALYAHAITVAGNPVARTPQAFNATPPPAASKPATTELGRQPTCYICGNTKTACEALHEFEIKHGIPDPHIFETHEEADANTGKVQFDPTQLALAAMPRVNEYEESDERKAAKARAREAVAEARRKATWKPAPPASDRRIQQPEPTEQEQPA